MRRPRREPVTLEQGLIVCDMCGETLAVIDSLGDHVGVTYLWKPRDGEDPPRCHAKPLSAYAAQSMFLAGGCPTRQAVITDYHWREPEIIPHPFPEEEPVLAPLTAEEQLEIEMSYVT